MVINVQFHLSQEAINQFTVVIALDNTNQIILITIDNLETIDHQDILETIEVQEILETIDHQDILETIEVQEILEIILDLGEKVIEF